MAKKKKKIAKGSGLKTSAGKVLNTKGAKSTKALPVVDILPEDALSALIDILSSSAIWKDNADVKVLCKMVGAHIINLNADIDNLSSELKSCRSDIDKALQALGCI